MKRSGRLLLIGALALLAPSCLGDGGGGGGGEFRVAQVVGAVTMQIPGEAARPLGEKTAVPAGAALVTGRDARVRLERDDRHAIELGPDTRATILDTRRVSLDIGSALGEWEQGSMSFDSRGVNVRIAEATARILRKLGTLSVGVYEGMAQVDLLGRSVEVPRYRQQDFSGGIPIDRNPIPLSLKANDPWDRRLLGDVIELDARLEQFGRGFNSEFGQEAGAATFFVSFVTFPRADRVAAQAPPVATPADKLIGLVFAQQLARRDRSDANVGRYFNEMLAEFQQGASWGLIAKERGLELRLLLPAVLDAIRRGTTPAASGGGGSGGGGGVGGGSQPTSSPTSRPRTRPPGSPSPSPSPTPTPPPCDILDRLLGNCAGAQSDPGSSGAPPATECSILGVLLDPNC